MLLVIFAPLNSTKPAPFKSALGASHVFASKILLNRNSAFGTTIRSIFASPRLEQLCLSAFTRFAFVPWNQALEAKVFSALVTLDFSRFFGSFYNHVLTFRIRTILFVLTEQHLMVLLIRFELVKCFLVNILL